MSIAQNYPAIKPTLLLDFANTEQLDPRITFTRASTGTYYDGKTVAKAEQNLLIRSQEFENALWNPVGVSITANTTVAPDGTTTADTANEGTANSLHHFQQTGISFTSGLSYTQSVFAKADTATVVQMLGVSSAFGSNAFANYDLSTGTLGTVGSSATATITAVGNGWYRLTLTATATINVPNSFGGFIFLCDNNPSAARAPSYTGTNKQLYLWGAQVEQRSSVTAYTATTTQPITNYIPQLLTAASGVARFEHNPTTGESLGLEIEESRTNLLVRSEEFGTSWSITNASLSVNTEIAPDGTLSSDKLITSSATVNGQVFQSLSKAASAITYTSTIFAKAGEWNTVGIYVSDSASFSNRADINVNLSTGVISQAATARGTFTSASGSVAAVGNGWYRVSLTFTTSSETSILNRIYSLDSVATTGNGFSGIYIWGAQLEAGAFATSYIPTVASQVTRAADAASMTGTNFSSWYRADEGTLYGESTVIAFSANQTVFTISDNVGSTSTQNMNIRHSGSTSGVSRAVINNSISQFDSVVNVSQGVKKLALAYQANNALFAVNGASGVVDTSVSLPNSVSQAQFGTATFLNSTLNGTIKKIAYYPVRIQNNQLQALTS